MKKAKKVRSVRRKQPAQANRWGLWVVVLGILIAVASYAANRLPASEAATGPSIKFITPTHTEDLDFNSKYLVKFSTLAAIPGGEPMTVEFHVRDYENDQNYALIQRMKLTAGQRNGNFSWHVGYDANGRRVKWLPKNHLFLTAKIIGGNASSSYEFHVVPEDDGTGKPVIYLVDPNRGWSEGGTRVAIHGRNLVGKKGMTEVYFADKRATIAIGSVKNGRRLIVMTPSREIEPLLVDVMVKNDRGSFTAKEAFEYAWRI